MSKQPPEQQNRGGWGMMAVGWLLATVVMTMIFSGVLEDRRNPNRLSVLQNQSGKLLLRANHDGHYYAEGYLNGTAVTFLLDTGATTVAVPAGVAERAGLQLGTAVPIDTAAGATEAYQTRIRRLTLGSLLFEDLRAVVIPGGGHTVLLGMNALGELQMTQRNGELILQAPAAAGGS